MRAPPRATRGGCPLPVPLLTLAQVCALFWTFASALARLAADLPAALLAAAALAARVAAPEGAAGTGGAIFYEGVVKHRRDKPVVHEFRSERGARGVRVFVWSFERAP